MGERRTIVAEHARYALEHVVITGERCILREVASLAVTADVQRALEARSYVLQVRAGALLAGNFG